MRPYYLLIAVYANSAKYYPLALNSFMASQFFPFFLKTLSRFFNSGCKLIYDAFYLDTLMRSPIILLGGKGRIPDCSFLVEIL
jgi:hypothetical protein